MYLLGRIVQERNVTQFSYTVKIFDSELFMEAQNKIYNIKS